MCRCSVIQSSSGRPISALGRMAASTWNHISHTSRRQYRPTKPLPFGLTQNGHSLFQNMTTTARIAPNWMTTSNISKKASDASILRNSPARIRCPVLEMGSHSVTPSRTPSSTASR